jgi:hypothetical protein
MMPNTPGPEPAHSAEEERAPAPVILDRTVYRWYHKIWAVLLITFCLEIGLFLAVFPWTSYWEINYFSQLLPGWHVLWYNPYLRGAVSGLGVLNLYIALAEIFRLRHFAPRDQR